MDHITSFPWGQIINEKHSHIIHCCNQIEQLADSMLYVYRPYLTKMKMIFIMARTA